DDAANQQERLKRQFDEFKAALLRLAQRLESNPDPKEKAKGEQLKKALTKVGEQGIDAKFTALVAALKKTDAFQKLDELDAILGKNEDLRKDPLELLALLQEDDRDSQLRKEREEIQRMLERLKEIIAKQERLRAQTEMGRRDPTDLAKDQDRVARETKGL